MNQKFTFTKVTHLEDWMSTSYSPVNSHVVAIGDDVYHDHMFYEIAYVLNGQIGHVVNGMQMDLSAGDVLFLRPTDKHIYLRTEDNDCAHRDIVINKEFFEKVCLFYGENFLSEYESREMPLKLSLSLDEIEIFEQELNRYGMILQNNDENKIVTAKFLLSKLLSYYYQHSVKQSDDRYPVWLNRLLEKMNMCEYYKAGLPTILSFFDYDRSYMCRVFRQFMGTTMTDYMNKLKIKYVANQLKLTNRTVLSICHDAGFSSVSHLNKLFKKIYGMTPKEFRKK